eukprot:c2956_g1_i2.p2 GENE.c2956_g1_i2~~c2956_g1_i2.p2  ORF type:complete len:118 (-),score=13.86 c2956_g1_i2:590-943(-)
MAELAAIRTDNMPSFHQDGHTALHIAVQSLELEIARVLIESGANPNTADNQGATPVHIAAKHGFLEVLELLTASGATINTPDIVGPQPPTDSTHRKLANSETEAPSPSTCRCEQRPS